MHCEETKTHSVGSGFLADIIRYICDSPSIRFLSQRSDMPSDRPECTPVGYPPLQHRLVLGGLYNVLRRHSVPQFPSTTKLEEYDTPIGNFRQVPSVSGCNVPPEQGL